MKPLLTTMALLLALHAAAQSLDDYRHAVVAYSHTLKTAATDLATGQAEAAVARTGRLPKLSAAGHFTLDARHSDNTKRWRFALEPQLVQTIYGGGGVRAAIRSAELEVDALLCEREFTRLEVLYAADYAYWNLSAAELYAASMREYVAIILSLRDIVTRRFDEGLIARGDVLMIDTRLSEARYALVAAEQRHEVALHNFNILRGAEPSKPVRLTQSIGDSMVMPARVALSEVLMRRGDYAAAELRTLKSEADAASVRADYNPQIGITLGGAWHPHSPNRNGSTLLDGTAQVALSVPIFHFGERRKAVRAARSIVQRNEIAAEQMRDAITLEETNAWTALNESRAQVEASIESLEIAGENLALGTYSYGEGLATILDVMQAQLSWIQLYTNAIDARYAYAVAIADYRRITATE